MSKSVFRKQALGPFFFIFLLKKLPLAFIAGVKLARLDDVGTETTLRFRWINQNPFRSVYFAAMHMAAELATGLLLFQYLDGKTKFSMLLVETSAEFSKKATGKINFQCFQGREVEEFIQLIMNNSEGDTIILPVVATNSSNEEVATFKYTWSCKKR